MIFTDNKKSDFSICNACSFPSGNYACSQLQKYVEQSLGVTLPIVTKLGKSNCFVIGKLISEKGERQLDINSFDLNGDGFVLKISRNNIYLDAQTPRGIIFGVFRFLEKYLGIRFFNSDCEKIPKHNKLWLEEGVIVEKPTFAMRSYLTGQLIMHDPPQRIIDYYLKLKLCNEHQHLKDEFGGECPMYGRGGTHNMSRYVPFDIYGEKHPEWYAYCKDLDYKTIDLLNGLTPEGKLDETIEESVAKVVIQELKKDIIANPSMRYFQFEQEDFSEPLHEYEDDPIKAGILKKYGRSGILIRFCNMLATELQAWADKELNGRKIYIVTFAYCHTRVAPVIEENGVVKPIDETVVAVDNVIIRLATGENGVYPYFDERQKNLWEILRGWVAVAKKFMLWGYDTDFVSGLWYYPTMRHIKRNILDLKDIGFIYTMFESADSFVYDWQTDLKAYLYSSLMWNKDQCIEDLYNEYLDYFYAEASEDVKKIIAIYENYSVYCSTIYDKYFVDTFAWNYRHHDVQSLKLYDRLLEVYEHAKKSIIDGNSTDKELYLKRLEAIHVTILHMQINKINDDLYKAIKKSRVVQFSGLSKIPENKGQSFYNIEMVWNVKEKVVIPEEVQKKIRELDVYTISDKLVFDK